MGEEWAWQVTEEVMKRQEHEQMGSTETSDHDKLYTFCAAGFMICLFFFFFSVFFSVLRVIPMFVSCEIWFLYFLCAQLFFSSTPYVFLCAISHFCISQPHPMTTKDKKINKEYMTIKINK